MATANLVRIGTAGWAVPRQVAERFPSGGTGLQRYAAVFGAVEINTTFYRPHRPQTYERWRDTTPAGFRFAVKAPRALTHEARLVGGGDRLESFLAEVGQLGEKLGPVLFQLPPSLAFDAPTAEAFFRGLRSQFTGGAVVEPRHASWFDPAADVLLAANRIARVAADPALNPTAAKPGGWPGLAYWRWHGSPRMYFSAYGENRLSPLAQALSSSASAETWCIFDNTASGAAAADALRLQDQLGEAGRASAGSGS